MRIYAETVANRILSQSQQYSQELKSIWIKLMRVNQKWVQF